MRSHKLLALVLASSLLVWAAALLLRINENTNRNEDLCAVLYTLIVNSEKTLGKPGTPLYAYYRDHRDELGHARRQTRAFLDQLPCQPKGLR